MKSIFIKISAILAALFFFSQCDNREDCEFFIEKTINMGPQVGRHAIIVHKETRVKYLKDLSTFGGGSMVMLYDAEGKPLLYEGELQ